MNNKENSIQTENQETKALFLTLLGLFLLSAVLILVGVAAGGLPGWLLGTSFLVCMLSGVGVAGIAESAMEAFR